MPIQKEDAVKKLQNTARELFAKEAVKQRKIEINQKKTVKPETESTQQSLEITEIKLGI